MGNPYIVTKTFRICQQLGKTLGAPRHVSRISRSYLILSDGQYFLDAKPDTCLARKRIASNSGRSKKYIRRALDFVGTDQLGIQETQMRLLNDNVDHAHAAISSARSIRRSMVQIPSMPGRHAVLCRDHRCQR